MKLRLEKCEFFRKQVTYLGHVISAEGLKPSEKRVDAVVNFPKPENVKQLESFIGKLNYYGKFLPSFSTICAPLNRLRRNNVTWHWSAECDEAYSSLKQMLAQQTRLVHYDRTKPLSLATDASPYGIGAVISQCDTNGVEYPIAFASKTLTDAEKNYGHVEKEALNNIWSAKIPPVPLRSTFHAHHRSQTATNGFQPSEKSASDDTAATTTMGADSNGIRL